jgi:hypothetical protein
MLTSKGTVRRLELLAQKDTSQESEELFDRRLENITGMGIDKIRVVSPDEGDKVVDAAEMHTCPPYQLVLRGDALWSLYYLIPEDVPDGRVRESMCRELILKEDEEAPDSSVDFEADFQEELGIGISEFITRAVPLHDTSDTFMEFALNRYVLIPDMGWRLERFFPTEVLPERPGDSINILDRPKRLLLKSLWEKNLFDNKFQDITGFRISEFVEGIRPIRIFNSVDVVRIYARRSFMLTSYQDGSYQLHEFTDTVAGKKEYSHTYTFSFYVVSESEDHSDVTPEALRLACDHTLAGLGDDEMKYRCAHVDTKEKS